MGDNPFEVDDDDNPFADKGGDDYNPFDDSMFDKKVHTSPFHPTRLLPTAVWWNIHVIPTFISFLPI